MIVALALVAALASAQQPPAKPAPKPVTAPPAPQAPRPPEAPQPPPAEAPPPPQVRNQPINVKVEVTITEQRGKSAPTRKLLTIIAADGFRNAIRSQETFFPPMEVPLNIDVTPNILTEFGKNTGKIRLILNLEYDLPGFAGGPEPKKTATGEWERTTTKSAVRENLIMILDDGKPLVAAQSADPVSDRQVTVEVRATVLK